MARGHRDAEHEGTKTTLLLDGLGCAGGSAYSLEAVLRRLPGVASVYVNPVTNTARVAFDPDRCTEADLVRAAGSLGIRAAPPGASLMTHRTHLSEQELADVDRRVRLRWAFTGFALIAGFFLLTEHRAHLLGALPFLFLLLCPLLHLFGHGGHGRHGRDDPPGPQATRSDGHDHDAAATRDSRRS